MYKIIIFICLLFTHASHASGLTTEDLREIMDMKIQYSCHSHDQYQKTFGEPWTPDPAQVLSFRLKSGVDVAVTYNAFVNFKDSYQVMQADSALAAPFRPALGTEFQDYPLPVEFMTDPNTPFTIQMCKKYGKVCNEKFDLNDRIAIKLALSQPGKTATIKDGLYKVSANESSLTQVDCLRRLLLAPNTLGFSIDPEFRMNFRHLSPLDEENTYTLFLCSINIYRGDLGQEEAIGTFTGEQTAKPL
ncbi:MAG: hypothetical protein ACRYGR_06410 [Janthinobacterium lividum]